jgi:hypothetical protein
MATTIEPCKDPEELRRYIDLHWRANHVLARDPSMFAFQYQTPWVDQSMFPYGISVLCARAKGNLVGLIGSTAAPYPSPRSLWFALWHVLPTLKGSGLGGQLLLEMQRLVLGSDNRGWLGGFGVGPESFPVFLKRGFACRAVRRWVFDPSKLSPVEPAPQRGPLNSMERPASEEWRAFRYDRHPIFGYERRTSSIFRTERNEWGLVSHVLTRWGNFRDDAMAVYERDRITAEKSGLSYLMDAWSVDQPGSGWTLAPSDLPSVFNPPHARGNLTYASALPYQPFDVEKGDGDQDRPN